MCKPWSWSTALETSALSPDMYAMLVDVLNGEILLREGEGLLTAPLKLRKTESSCLKEIPLQILPMGMWGPENMKIEKFRWGLIEFYIFLP